MKGKHKSGIQVAYVLSSAMCWNGLPKCRSKLVCGRDLGCLPQFKAFGCWETPLGHADNVKTQLCERLDDHQLSLNRI